MAVILAVDNIFTKILGDQLPPQVKQRIYEDCSYAVVGAEFSAYAQDIYCPKCRKQTKEPTTAELYAPDYPTQGLKGYRRCSIHGWVKPIRLWDGTTCLFDGRSNTIPTGLIARIVSILKATNIPFTIRDNRMAPITRTLPWHGKQPRYYQKAAVREVLKRTRGIIQAATGTGKTLCISLLLKETCVNTLILTHTKSVFHQVANSITESLKAPVGRIGDGIVDVHKFTVAMPQSLTETITVPKRKLVKGVWKTVSCKQLQVKPCFQEVLNNTEMLITDEAHHLSATTCQLISNMCPNAYYRVGVSATPWRDDLLDILIESVTGRNIYQYTATQAIKDGYLAKPNIHLVRFKQKNMPLTMETQVTDKKGNVAIKRVKVDYSMLYDERVINNVRRNYLISKIARKLYKEGKSCLIIVKRLAHGEAIYDLLKDLGEQVRYVNGEDHPDWLQQTLNDLDQKKFMVCIATGIFSEGVDIRRLDSVINTTAGDSSVQAMQVVGRALRKVVDKNGVDLKPVVDIYDICDYGVRWLGKHATNREAIYATEEGYTLLEEDESNYL